MSEIIDGLVEKRVQEAVHECRVGIAKNLIIRGMLIMEVAECTELPLEEVKELWDQLEAEMSAREAVYEYRVGVAKKLLAREKLSLEEIAEYSGLSVEEVRRLAEERENDEHSGG